MINFIMDNPSITPVAYTTIACTNASLSTDKIVYTENITLADNIYNSANGYYLVWERCCRNGVINNIFNPGAAGQTFYLEFPAVTRNGQAFRNSSPELFTPVSDYACLNDLFYYEFGGKDPDGDSLVYEMVTPLNGSSQQNDPAPIASSAPYSLVQWPPGLSTANQIPGNPGLTVTLNTGLLTVRPTQLGLFVFSVRCAEYRNKIKIGEVRRDFQLLVLNCPRNEPPAIKMKTAASASYYREGEVLTINGTEKKCLNFFLTDVEPNADLKVEAKGVNFALTDQILSITSGIVNRNGLPDTLVTTACFKSCLDSKGKPFIVDFIVSDNGCSLPKKDTVRVSLIFIPEPDTPPVISTTAATTLLQPEINDLITFDVLGLDADNEDLTLSLTGRNFDISTQNISFENKSGKGQVTSPFSWQLDCTTLTQESYLLDFTVTNTRCGVPVTKVTSIEIKPGNINEVPAFIPANIFTPNNDGLNDYFTLPTLPPDLCASVFTEIKIYNRWGNRVYASADRNFKWDGKAVIDGIYYYVVSYSDKEFKGTVTIVK